MESSHIELSIFEFIINIIKAKKIIKTRQSKTNVFG